MAVAPDERSCYVLEYSVGPGGARLGDAHAYGDFAQLRAAVDDHYGGGEGLDPYLLMWYGAMLQLWVFDQGSLIAEIDLHPFLRTGNAVWDRTLARLIGFKDGTEPEDMTEEGWHDLDGVLQLYGFDCVEALPLLTHIFAVRDRAVAGDEAALAEYEDLVYALEKPPPYPDQSPDVRFTLDWDAIAAVVPPLTEPVLSEGWTTLSMPPDIWEMYEKRQSYLTIEKPLRLHIGWNDLEFGEDGVEDPLDC